jgi:hypothetical protein
MQRLSLEAGAFGQRQEDLVVPWLRTSITSGPERAPQ